MTQLQGDQIIQLLTDLNQKQDTTNFEIEQMLNPNLLEIISMNEVISNLIVIVIMILLIIKFYRRGY